MKGAIGNAAAMQKRSRVCSWIRGNVHIGGPKPAEHESELKMQDGKALTETSARVRGVGDRQKTYISGPPNFPPCSGSDAAASHFQARPARGAPPSEVPVPSSALG